MSCEGCISSPAGQDLALDAKIKEAYDYAAQNNVSVAIYPEGGQYLIMEAFAAYSAGLGPVIKQIVSKHQ
jgi:hypothetical protein